MKKFLKVIVLTLALVLAWGCQAPMKNLKMDSIPVNLDISVDQKDCKVVEHGADKSIANKYGLKEDSGLPALSQLSFILNGWGHTKIFSGLSVSDVTRTWNDFTIFEGIGIKNVKVFINSPGGDAFSGLALARMVSHFTERGLNIEMHASGIIASAAVPVFASAKNGNRYAMHGTIFMVHEAALWKWPGRETASDIRSQNELMNLLRDTYLGILTTHSLTPINQWEQMEGRTTWFSVDKAIEFGLVDFKE